MSTRDPSSERPSAGAAASLTPRQREILRLLCEGKANKEIARELDIGVGTVKQHVVALFKRLNVRNRAMAVSRGMALLEDGARSSPVDSESSFAEEGILERRPCVVLSVSLPPASAPASARSLHRTLAGLAYDGEALFLARRGCAGDLLFGIHRPSEHHIVAALQLATALRDELVAENPTLCSQLRGALMVGMAVVSARRYGGWSGEAVASPVIAEAREALVGAADGELVFGAQARHLMAVAGLGGGRPLPERLPFSGLGALRRLVAMEESALVGREVEWERLEAALEAAGAGRGGVLRLEGESGMGKSHLCRMVASRCDRMGGRVWFYHALPVALPNPLCDMEGGRAVAPDALAGHLDVPPTSAPNLMIVDDFHLLEEGVRQTLIERAASAAERGWLVLLAGRRVSVEGVGLEAIERLHLGRLSQEAIEILIDRLRPERKAGELGRWAELAAGVPLFAVELVRLPEERVPLPLLMTVAARLDGFKLDWKLLHTLARSAVEQGGGESSLPLLAEAMGEPIETVRRGVEHAAKVGVLILEDEDQRVAFRHPLIRRVIDFLGVELGTK